MFESYLFIPASKGKFIDKSKTLENLDHRIFDLEDSVVEAELDKALANLEQTAFTAADWVRVPIGREDQTQLLKKVHHLGLNNFVIPKFNGYDAFADIFAEISGIAPKARFILLLENPKAYLDLERILKEFSESIDGVSLGIHDFTFETGMRNSYQLLRNIRVNIMLIAKAYGVQPIDVVSIHLKKNELLKEEILDGFTLGYRSKLFIHPSQLQAVDHIEFYSFAEVKELFEVYQYYQRYIRDKEAVFSYNNRVYEKMHIEEIKRIVEWGASFYGTAWQIL